MKILLDTNFIITAVKDRLHFFEQLEEIYGFPEILIPKQVIDEIEKIRDNEGKRVDKEASELALHILKNKKFSTIQLDKKEVDAGIIAFCLDNPAVLIATLDKELREKILKKSPSTKFLVIKQRSKIQEMWLKNFINLFLPLNIVN